MPISKKKPNALKNPAAINFNVGDIPPPDYTKPISESSTEQNIDLLQDNTDQKFQSVLDDINASVEKGEFTDNSLQETMKKMEQERKSADVQKAVGESIGKVGETLLKGYAQGQQLQRQMNVRGQMETGRIMGEANRGRGQSEFGALRKLMESYRFGTK